jgi:hypothetical protein
MIVTVDIFSGACRRDHPGIGGMRPGADLRGRFVLRLAGDVVGACPIERGGKPTFHRIGNQHDALLVVAPHPGEDLLPIGRRKLVQGAAVNE